MSFELPPQQSPSRGRKRGGGGGLFILIILGIGGFLLMNMMSGGPRENLPRQDQPSANGNQQSDYDRQREQAYQKDRKQIFGQPKQEQRKRMPSGSTAGNVDWSIEDAGSNPVERKAQAKSTQKGDWSIEEVYGGKKKQESKTDFRLSGEATGKQSPTKSESGDWSIEEVKGKESPKKTKKGDWSVEEVDG